MSHINPGEQPARNVDGDGDLPRIGFLRQDAERFLAVWEVSTGVELQLRGQRAFSSFDIGL